MENKFNNSKIAIATIMPFKSIEEVRYNGNLDKYFEEVKKCHVSNNIINILSDMYDLIKTRGDEMITIELVVKNRKNKIIIYQSNIIPRIDETIICDNMGFTVIDVVHYSNKNNIVSLIVEEQ